MGRPRRFDVFLSYHSADRLVVEEIAYGLKRHGVEPWLDSWYLSAGVNWQRELAETLTACGCCAVFVGASALGVWEQQELEVALDRAARDRDFRVFMVLLPGVPDPFDATVLSPF